MFTDFVLNGEMHGPVGQRLREVRYEPGLLRPFFSDRGERCVSINSGQYRRDEKGNDIPIKKTVRIADLMAKGIYSPVFNATTLRKQEWIELDKVIIRAARERLRAWADLSAANSVGGFDAMAKTTFEYEAMSDPGVAVVDMDGVTPGRADQPLFKLRSIPLPITHSDFTFTSRQLATSNNSGQPLDTTMGEAAARRVAETIEQTLIGTITGVSYGGQSTGVTAHDTSGGLAASKIYGYTNFPHRNTKTNLTAPTGTNPGTTLSEVLTMRNTLYADKFYGPYMVYHSTDWDTYLDNDYYVTSTGAPYQTLRDRLRRIEGIMDVRRLDFLTSTFTLIMVQMTSDVARAINGMGITTVQWETMGGMQQHFKVMAIQVPQLRSDYNGNCGILHGSTA